MSAAKKTDGKVRLRCSECGKKLKLPADGGGQIYRCPICMNVVISPLIIEEEPAPVQKGKEASSPTFVKKQPAETWTPSLATKPRNDSIDRLVIFLSKENNRVGTEANNLLRSKTSDDEQKTEKLMQLRREKALNLKREVDRLREELVQRIETLRRHPASNQAQMKQQLAQKEEEKSDFDLFLRTMFGIEE